MIIRLATEDDLDKLKPLAAWFCEELEVRFGVPRADALVFDTISYAVSAKDAVAIAVDDYGDIVAWCARTQLPNLPEGYSEGVGLWVHPNTRRERIGTDVRDFADKHAKSRGAKYASCTVAKGNDAGIESCLKQGYEVVGYQLRRKL